MHIAFSVVETAILLSLIIGYSVTRGSNVSDLFFALAALVIPYSLLRIVSSPRKGSEYKVFRFLVIIAITIIVIFVADIAHYGHLNLVGDL